MALAIHPALDPNIQIPQREVRLLFDELATPELRERFRQREIAAEETIGMTVPFAAITEDIIRTYRGKDTELLFHDQPEPITERNESSVPKKTARKERARHGRRRNSKVRRLGRFIKNSALNVWDDLVLWAYGKGFIDYRKENRHL